jgi:IS5 family transposase
LDDLIEIAIASTASDCRGAYPRRRGHPFRVNKQQFGFKKTHLRGMLINRCNVNVMAALSDLKMVGHEMLCRKMFIKK